MATHSEQLEVLRHWYGEWGCLGKTRIWDEFVAVTGCHRKRAVRLPMGEGSSGKRRGRRRRYGDAVGEALIVAWEASNQLCGKRLHALLPDLVASMERHGYLELGEEVGAVLLSVDERGNDRPPFARGSRGGWRAPSSSQRCAACGAEAEPGSQGDGLRGSGAGVHVEGPCGA